MLLHACFCSFDAVLLQDQVQGYSALSQQLAQDYNVHAAAVMGVGPSALPAASRPGTSQAAAAAGQPGPDGLSEMSEEELQRCRRQAGGELVGVQSGTERYRVVQRGSLLGVVLFVQQPSPCQYTMLCRQVSRILGSPRKSSKSGKMDSISIVRFNFINHHLDAPVRMPKLLSSTFCKVTMSHAWHQSFVLAA
jgi:hypothetical protein